MKFKNFNVADVLNVNDVEIAKSSFINLNGYFANTLESLDNLEFFGTLNSVSKITPFAYHCQNDTNFKYFLPLGKVKKTEPVETKEEKYRVVKSMRELTEIVYGKNWEYINLSVGDSLLIRRKGDEHFYQNLLITSLGYDENDLISMNGKSMQEWLNEFEFLANCEWRPFGVEIEGD